MKEKSKTIKNKENKTKKKKTTTSKKNKKISKKITKEKIIYTILAIIDIAIIIYAARKNYANYVSIAGSDNIYIGEDTKNLIFGKNYITLITTVFFFTYICLINKFLFHKKNTKKFVFILLISLLIINCIIFYAFTNKIY